MKINDFIHPQSALGLLITEIKNNKNAAIGAAITSLGIIAIWAYSLFL